MSEDTSKDSISSEEFQEFHDFTVKGELEFLINELQKIGGILSENEHEFHISFEFRGSKFSIHSVNKAKSEEALESLGQLGLSSANEQLLWRMFDVSVSWIVIIRCDDPDVHLSVETTKLFLSAVSCSSVFRSVPVMILRNNDGEFLSCHPFACSLKIYGEWGPADALKWVQAKLSNQTSLFLPKISIYTTGQLRLPFLTSFSPVVSPRAVFLPVGRYFKPSQAQISVDFINPCAQPSMLDYEQSPIWRIKLLSEPSKEPTVIDAALNMLRTLEHISGQLLCPGENEDLHSKTTVVSAEKHHQPADIFASLLQFVLFASDPKPFKERFMLALLATFIPTSSSGYSSLKRGKELLNGVLKLYNDIVQAIGDVLESSSAETLGIEGILPKPVWSDPLVLQHINSIEFMLHHQRKDRLKPEETSGMDLLHSNRPLIIPATLDDGSEGMTSDWADIHSDASIKTQKDQRAYKRLTSDMQAFKAANLDSCLADFVRWHSPRDWDDKTRTLSERMSAEDSDWSKMWEELPPLSAEEQPPLFTPEKEIAKSLHYLQHLEVRDWLQQMNTHFRSFASSN